MESNPLGSGGRNESVVEDASTQALVEAIVGQLRARRIQRGLSMYRVAKLTGLHASTIGLVERGERSPSLFVVLKIAAALELSLGGIISGCSTDQNSGKAGAASAQPELEDSFLFLQDKNSTGI
jgi:transcriptional regulator with XRE-family HTH domain